MSRVDKTAKISLLALVFCTFSFGQSSVATASLNGTVTDPSGATVSGAQVTARDADTGFVRQSVTTAAGLYNLTDLPVGAYELTVQQPGFNSSVRSNIRLTVGTTATVNIQLQVGATTQRVDVSAEVPIVETSRTETSTAISNRQIQNLPIN